MRNSSTNTCIGGRREYLLKSLERNAEERKACVVQTKEACTDKTYASAAPPLLSG